jgi:chemotaxis protein MotA
MNIWSILGLFLLLGVVLAGVVTTITPKEYHMFADLPAIFLVVGGTLGVASITVQLNKVGTLFKIFFIRLIKGKRIDYKIVIKEVMISSESYRRGESLPEIINKVHDHFFKECLQLIDDNVVKGEELFDLLDDRVRNMHSHYSEEANRFKNLAKFPPAFGLMGTVLGMIALLSNLGGADAMKLIGPAMGTCLVATFLGILMANVVVLPVGESLSESSKETYLKNKIIVEGIRLIVAKTNPIIVAEKLNTFLLPSERVNWKELVSNEGKS